MMHGHRCIRCSLYWASQADPEHYSAITRFCPNCIERYMPVDGEAPLAPAPRERDKPIRVPLRQQRTA